MVAWGGIAFVVRDLYVIITYTMTVFACELCVIVIAWMVAWGGIAFVVFFVMVTYTTVVFAFELSVIVIAWMVG
jgi:hypothetical protein